MLKRILCAILAASIIFTGLPINAAENTGAENTGTENTGAENTGTETGGIGDADGNGSLDAQDIKVILQYIAGNNPPGFQTEKADFTKDGIVDLKDLLEIRKLLAEITYRVSFYDGDWIIETFYVVKDRPLEKVPSADKSSKENAVLSGYFTDQAFTEPFYADNPVTKDTDVYAKYQKMDGAAEDLSFTSFAQMDQSPDLSFKLKRVSGSIPSENITSENAVTLVVKDGSEPVALKIEGPDASGCYKVYAPGGFRKGSSYELNLEEGWVFEGKEATIRTTAFSIAMDEVQKLRMSDEIIYIKDTDTINYTVDGTQYAELASKDVTEKGGDISYAATDAEQFQKIENDSILCIYVGVHPNKRDPKQGKQLLDPAVYVKAASVGSTRVSFVPLGADDQIRMYDIPDNFPIALNGTGANAAMDDSADEESAVTGSTETNNASGSTEAESSADSTDKNSSSAVAEAESNADKNGSSGDTAEKTLPESTEETLAEESPAEESPAEETAEIKDSYGTDNQTIAGAAKEAPAEETLYEETPEEEILEEESPEEESAEKEDAYGTANEESTEAESKSEEESSAGESSIVESLEEESSERASLEEESSERASSGEESSEEESSASDIMNTAGTGSGAAWKPNLKTDKGTVKLDDLLNALDLDMYHRMMGDESLTAADAQKKISDGDFITLYSSSDQITSEDSLYYAEITGITEITDNGRKTYEIAYKKTTKQAILDSMDIYEKAVVTGDDLINEEQKQEIETMLLSQLEESGFAEEAAYVLGDIVTRTDGFRKNPSVQEFLLSDENGNPLSDAEIRQFNLGGSFDLADEVSIKAELITNGSKLHFGNGVQLAIRIKAQFEADAKDGRKTAIDLYATFVQEVALDPSVRGDIVTKQILFIPVPIGVEVNAALDIKNYTAFSFSAEIYTVGKSSLSDWESIKKICQDPTKLLGLDGLPDDLKADLKTVGDAMDKIKEIRFKIDQSETSDKINAYQDDLDDLWGVVEKTRVTDRKSWEEMEKSLGKTNVASGLFDMMNLADEEEISTEYLDSMQKLMDKYVETVQKQTDWIQLVDKEIMSRDFYLGTTPIVVGAAVNFVVRADMSIAIGSNLEYEVGKRYNFWFKIGLFKPSAGNSTMDLLDERFAFQFYVMGRLGLKAGIRAKLYAGLGSGKFASVGITAELGPYVKLYGFFVYENTKRRPANTQNWTSKERMAGALYLDFGLYFKLGFEANALGRLFEYKYEFLDKEIPLLQVGEPRYYYQNAYQPKENEIVRVRDEDNNSANGITMKLPDDKIALSYVDLDTGQRGSEALDYSKYSFTVSNPNFNFDPKTGVISVNVPENTRIMRCSLTVTYLYGKMAFSQYDMSVTIPLAWSNLSEDDLKELYTASVRVGNGKDGYQTVWRKQLFKNEPFDLPSDDEIKQMIGWSDAKFTGGTGYGSQRVTGLTLIQDTAYDYNVTYKQYSLTVKGIQNADGTTRSETFTAKYGERFNFSGLAKSGIEKPGEQYTKFAGVTTDAVITAGGTAGGKAQVIDLTQAVAGRAAEAIDKGISAKAEYIDDGIKVAFEFTGITHNAVNRLIRRGTVPDLDEILDIIAAANPEYDLTDISPAFGRVDAPTTFLVYCGILTGPKATLAFHANGGSDVKDLTKTVGAYLGSFPAPTKTGYSFGGWYTDDGTFQNQYKGRKMPEGGVQLYAKWTANKYTVTYNVNSGNELDEAERAKTVTYGGKYGSLPEPSRSGYAFIGWFTENDGGTQITADTDAAVPNDHTLYAHWRKLKEIPASVFDFGAQETGTYKKDTTHEVLYDFNAADAPAGVKESQFTVKYMRDGADQYEEGAIKNAGNYFAVVSRPADDTYAKFEQTYMGVLKIDKATRTIGKVNLEAESVGYTYIAAKLAADSSIDDLWPEAKIECFTNVKGTVSNGNRVDLLSPNTDYDFKVKVTGDNNYYDATSQGSSRLRTASAPRRSWIDAPIVDTSWYSPKESVLTVQTQEELAGLSLLSQTKTFTFEGKTIKLGANLDMKGYSWPSIEHFKGTFDGQGYSITNLYCGGTSKVGFFSELSGDAVLKNLYIGASYFGGRYQDVGGAVAVIHDTGKVVNCVVSAVVENVGDNTGGIVGRIGQGTKGATVRNIESCMFYGKVYGHGKNTGGILGLVTWKDDDDADDKGAYQVTNEVVNCANFGYVSGQSTHIGGITGRQWGSDKHLYNCFNVGTVTYTSHRDFVGAIMGRNSMDQGQADYYYYRSGSAGSGQKGLGAGSGSVDNKGKNVASFSGVSYSKTLMDNLNQWTRNNLGGNDMWEIVKEGEYPTLINMPGRR